MVELEHKETSLMDTSKLIPYSNNPKNHPSEQVDKIASSIKSYGFIQPIVVDKDNEVIIGHGRLQAAKKLGLEQVPVIKHDDLTEAEVKALRLADNRIAETDWQSDKLAVELEKLTEGDDFEQLVLGFDEDELNEYLDEAKMLQDFQPTDGESQGALDQLKPEIVECPECGHEFDAKNNG